jgi:hypothetical protein
MAKSIPLYLKKEIVAYAIVDDDDYDWLSQRKWYLNIGGYAVTNIKKGTTFMHRRILNPPTGTFTDHIDGNRLNNQRNNLRAVSAAENNRNSRAKGGASGYKGVSWHKASQKWNAQLRCDYKHVHIGLFDSIIEAAHAYDEAAKKHFGTFARPNFPEEL